MTEKGEKKPRRIAVVGATGVVGECMLSCLAERNFPIAELIPLASERSEGETVSFGKKFLRVRDLAKFDFKDTEIALFSAGASVSEQYAPRAVEAGCVVIDNTSCFRYEDDIPLVVVEVNPEAIAGHAARGIIANPNCSTMQMLVALAPIHRAAGIARINVCTYQSVSGAGRAAMDELARQTSDLLNFRPANHPVLGRQIAFNVIAAIDEMQSNGFTREEMKLVWETHKILGDPEIGVNATAVRVPVFYGHAEAVHLETRDAIDIPEVLELMKSAPGVEWVGDDVPTPVTHAAGKDPVYVARVRRDLSHPRGIDLWIVADNVRKGAALNAVQIAERLVDGYI